MSVGWAERGGEAGGLQFGVEGCEIGVTQATRSFEVSLPGGTLVRGESGDAGRGERGRGWVGADDRGSESALTNEEGGDKKQMGAHAVTM